MEAGGGDQRSESSERGMNKGDTPTVNDLLKQGVSHRGTCGLLQWVVHCGIHRRIQQQHRTFTLRLLLDAVLDTRDDTQKVALGT